MSNASNIKKNTYMHTHKHMHTHVHAHTFLQIFITTYSRQRGFVFQPPLGYHQLVSYNDTKAIADFHLLQSFP